MSKRRESALDPKLFTKGYISSTEIDKETNGSKVDNESYTLKGTDKKKQNSQETKIDRDALSTALEILRAHSNEFVNRLDMKTQEWMDNMTEALRLKYDDPDEYGIIMGEIQEKFKGITNVIPGTVAAYFIGCLNNGNFNGPIGCNPRCAAALPPSSDKNYAVCEDTVLMLNENGLASLNDTKSDHAYIYIADSRTSEFTREEIVQLQASGIKTVTIVRGLSQNGYQEISGPITISRLAVKKESEKSKATDTDTSGSNTGWGVAVIVIIIVALIILVLAMLYLRRF